MVHPALLAGPQGRCCLSDGDELDSPLSPLLAPPSVLEGACLPLSTSLWQRTPWSRIPGDLEWRFLLRTPCLPLGSGVALGILFAHILLGPLPPLFKHKHFQGGILCVCSSIQTASSPHMCVVSVLTTERSRGRLGEEWACSLPLAFPCSPGTTST